MRTSHRIDLASVASPSGASADLAFQGGVHVRQPPFPLVLPLGAARHRRRRRRRRRRPAPGRASASSRPRPPPALTPEAAAGFQTTDKLVLTVNLPAADKTQPADTLRVELIDPDGKVIDSGEQQAQPGDAPTTHRFELLSPKLPADKVTLRCTFGKEKMETPLDKVLLVKAHETALSGGQEFFAGGPASLRCEVHGVKSFTETVPLAASVTIQLTGKDGKPIPLYEGKTGPDGVAEVQLRHAHAARRDVQDAGRHQIRPRRGEAGARREDQDRPARAARHRQAALPARTAHAPAGPGAAILRPQARRPAPT